MGAVIIDGKEIAKAIKERAAKKALMLKKAGITPCLAVILVGNNPASVSYVAAKRRALEDTGMDGCSIYLKEDVSEAELLQRIEELNCDESVHGILLQLPLPPHLDADKVISFIRPDKDVDGLHPVNIGNMMRGSAGILPCTPLGIIEILNSLGIDTNGSHAVVIGRSNIVGKPVAMLLAQKRCNCTVTLCHSGTKDLPLFTRQADILVAAAGRPHMVTADMIKRGAVVIDVGVNRITDSTKKQGYRLEGDVDFESAKGVASFITPVPGGVGPMTVAMLMQNTVEASERAALQGKEQVR